MVYYCSRCDHRPFSSREDYRFHLNRRHGEDLRQIRQFDGDRVDDVDEVFRPSQAALARRLVKYARSRHLTAYRSRPQQRRRRHFAAEAIAGAPQPPLETSSSSATTQPTAATTGTSERLCCSYFFTILPAVTTAAATSMLLLLLCPLLVQVMRRLCSA